MKKILTLIVIFIFLLSTGCSNDQQNTFDFTTDDLIDRIENALAQMDDKTNLKLISAEVNEDGRYVITLSENIFIFVEFEDKSKKVTKATLAATTSALFLEPDDLNAAFTLLVGTMDDTLSLGDRTKVINELELREVNLLDHTKVYRNNGVMYTYQGTKESILLQAEK